MAINATKTKAGGSRYSFASDGTVYALTFQAFAQHFDGGDDPSKAGDAPWVLIEGTPVDAKSLKPIKGAEPIRARYRVDWDLSHFVPAQVAEGDLSKLAAKCKISDPKEDDWKLYPHLATEPGASEAFLDTLDFGKFIAALHTKCDTSEVTELAGFDGVVCNFVEDPKKNPKSRFPTMIPGKVFLGPGGAKVDPKKIKAAEAEEDEGGDEEPATKKGGKGKKTAEFDAEEKAAELVATAVETKGGDDIAAVIKQANRAMALEDLTEDQMDEVAAILADKKKVTAIVKGLK